MHLQILYNHSYTKTEILNVFNISIHLWSDFCSKTITTNANCKDALLDFKTLLYFKGKSQPQYSTPGSHSKVFYNMKVSIQCKVRELIL